MCSDVTVKELASMALDEEAMCQIWTPRYGTIFDGSFREAENCQYINSAVDIFQIEDGVFVMYI